MKKRRHKLERVARWGVTLFTCTVAVAWATCQFRVAELILPLPPSDRHLLVFVDPDGVMAGIGRSSPPQPFMFDTAPRRSTDSITFRWPTIGTTARYVWVAAPHWSLVAAGAITAAWLWWRRSVNRHGAPDLVCAQCAYSRLGLAHDVPCPECGTLPTPEAAR